MMGAITTALVLFVFLQLASNAVVSCISINIHFKNLKFYHK